MSMLVLAPLSTNALSGLYPPGSSPGNPIHMEIEEPYESPLRFDTDEALQNSPWHQQQRQDAMINGHLPSNLQQSQQQVQHTPVYAPSQSFCPLNAHYAFGSCMCNTGYVASGNSCVRAQTMAPTLDQRCKASFGPFSYGANNSCYCISGYEWAPDRKSCVPQSNGITIIVDKNDNSVSGHYAPPSERKEPDVAPQAAPKAVGMPVCNKDFSNAPCTSEPAKETTSVSAATPTPQQVREGFWWSAFAGLLRGMFNLRVV